MGVTAICPDLHDLAASKCAAMREKDAEFVRVLFRHRLIELGTLLQRIALVQADSAVVESISDWARRRAGETTGT